MPEGSPRSSEMHEIQSRWYAVVSVTHKSLLHFRMKLIFIHAVPNFYPLRQDIRNGF